jgi:hypothetical protein
VQVTTKRIARFYERFRVVIPVLLANLSLGRAAEARRNGIAVSSCDGCHGNTGAEIRASADPAMFGPGADVTVTVTVASPGSKVGGLFLAAPAIGELRALDSEVRLLTGGLTHTAPKNANSAGETSFRFGWRAPSVPGSVRFEVFALSGNGDGRSSGDVAGNATISFAYGCTAATYYADLDRDGFGAHIASSIQDCEGADPEGYAARDGDCNDSYEKTNPLAPEICNKVDDDCDGAIDEGAPPVELWPDEDGDGYYTSQTGTSVMGCVPLRGYAALAGDCASRDPERHPGATEICNLLDDNCDGRVDERLRPQCGVGSCRRESPSCEAKDCTAGTPMPEVCNWLDDDCNDLIDDGATCPAGKTCIDGACVAGDDPTGGAGRAPSVPAGGTGGTPASGGATTGGGPAGPAGGSSSSHPGTSGSPGAAAGTPPASGGSGSDSDSASGCTVGGSRAAALGAWLFLGVMTAFARWRRRTPTQ